jgi:hypothetical protein
MATTRSIIAWLCVGVAALLLALPPAYAQQNRDGPIQIDPQLMLPVDRPANLRLQNARSVPVNLGEVDEDVERVRRTGSAESAAERARAASARARAAAAERERSSAESERAPRRTASSAGSSGDDDEDAEEHGGTRMVRAPGPAANPEQPIELGRLVVITGFEDVRVTVDGQLYPRDSTEGVLLYAGYQYEVLFESADESSRSSSNRVVPIRLAPGETRVLMANLGDETASRSRSSRRRTTARRSARDRDDDEDEEIGYLGVSSSPRGTVYIDGDNTGQMTPARRIELEPGRHEVQIFYESEEEMSETKNVLIRAGVNTNVFFRLRRDERDEDEED